MHINGEWSRDYTKAHENSIGLGSFGKVWLVKSNSNGKYYAMKEIDLTQSILKCSIINRSYALDEGHKLNYLKIAHSNVVKYYESYVLNNATIFWIMDYCDGGTLRDKLNIYAKSEQLMHENLIWYWSLQILSALKYLHSNHIIHRDLKPENIYIENKTGSCKIGDFGLSKVLVDSSITDNKTIRFSRIEDEYDYSSDASTDDEANYSKRTSRCEEAIVYKLINLSQVGTPAYMPPEMRNLIETHLNYCSIESVESAHRICETHLYKGDIFSFGCILYEMIMLKPAFENKFSLLVEDTQLKNNQQLSDLTNYSNDLKSLVHITMATSPDKRLNINDLFKLDFIQKRARVDYSIYYKQQCIPKLAINSKFARNNVLKCDKVILDSNYKPIAMKTLKFNQNLIVILASKYLNKVRNSSFRALTSTLNNLVNNTNHHHHHHHATAPTSREDLNEIECELDSEDYVEETKLIIYDEYGQTYREFNSFLVTNDTNITVDQAANREMFNFKINDFCVDEDNDHMYITTKKYGILRYTILKKNFYFEDLVFNGRLDLSELFIVENNMSKCYPTCLNLIENEAIFSDSMKTTNKRRLIFNDRLSKRLISIQVDLSNNSNNNNNSKLQHLKQLSADTETFADKLHSCLIKCDINAGLTLGQRFIRQMVSTDSELICLFDDLNLVNVYDLKTLLLKRSNNKDNSQQSNLSAKKNLFCLTSDSFNCLYSTDGECIFNLDLEELKPSKKIRPLIKKGENLSHIISWMSLLTNSKLILLSDAVQMENSLLFILTPVCKFNTTNATSSNLDKE